MSDWKLGGRLILLLVGIVVILGALGSLPIQAVADELKTLMNSEAFRALKMKKRGRFQPDGSNYHSLFGKTNQVRVNPLIWLGIPSDNFSAESLSISESDTYLEASRRYYGVVSLNSIHVTLLVPHPHAQEIAQLGLLPPFSKFVEPIIDETKTRPITVGEMSGSIRTVRSNEEKLLVVDLPRSSLLFVPIPRPYEEGERFVLDLMNQLDIARLATKLSR